VGGITPDAALLAGALATGLPCVAMARPTGGPFTLDAAQRRATLHDAEQLFAAGAHAVVLGGLAPDGRVDRDLLREAVAMAGPLDIVFHRAFDATPGPLEALDTLIEFGVARVLTSGHAPTAWEGRGTLANLVHRAAGHITVLPGGGVRAPHARALLNATGAGELHARATDPGVIAALRAAVSTA
jgi:copper homeostasis protein